MFFSLSRALARRLFSSGVSLLFTLLRARGEGSRALPTLVCSLYSPLFIVDPLLPSCPSSFSAPFVTRGCRPSAVLLSVFLLHVHVPLFSSSLLSSETPCVFPDNATESGQGYVFWICDAIFIGPQQTCAPCGGRACRVAFEISARHHDVSWDM